MRDLNPKQNASSDETAIAKKSRQTKSRSSMGNLCRLKKRHSVPVSEDRPHVTVASVLVVRIHHRSCRSTILRRSISIVETLVFVDAVVVLPVRVNVRMGVAQKIRHALRVLVDIHLCGMDIVLIERLTQMRRILQRFLFDLDICSKLLRRAPILQRGFNRVAVLFIPEPELFVVVNAIIALCGVVVTRGRALGILGLLVFANWQHDRN